MNQMELKINKEESTSEFQLIISDNHQKFEVTTDIIDLYDFGEFGLNMLSAFKFYLKHGFGEFEVVDTEYNKHHIILTLDDILVVTELFNADRFLETKVMRFEDIDCWQFIMDLMICFEKEKTNWNEYIENCIYNEREAEKLEFKQEKLWEKVKKILATFPRYDIDGEDLDFKILK